MPSKKRQTAQKLIDPNKTYSVEEALELIKKTASAKFDESIEAHFRLGINPQKGEQQVRGTVVLPHGTGQTKKILIFTKNIKEAQAAGADQIGDEQLINQIKTTGKVEADIIIATPDLMKELAQIAKILGPRGLMPSPKSGTVTTNLQQTITEFKKGKVEFKNDDTGNVHQIIGKKSMGIEHLQENFSVLLNAVIKAKPASSKGAYIKKVVLCSTMGPSVRITI